jgi:hypothetical protein
MKGVLHPMSSLYLSRRLDTGGATDALQRDAIASAVPPPQAAVPPPQVAAAAAATTDLNTAATTTDHTLWDGPFGPVDDEYEDNWSDGGGAASSWHRRESGPQWVYAYKKSTAGFKVRMDNLPAEVNSGAVRKRLFAEDPQWEAAYRVVDVVTFPGKHRGRGYTVVTSDRVDVITRVYNLFCLWMPRSAGCS